MRCVPALLCSSCLLLCCVLQVVVFSKTYCPYCIKAKKALASLVKPDQMEVIEVR